MAANLPAVGKLVLEVQHSTFLATRQQTLCFGFCVGSSQLLDQAADRSAGIWKAFEQTGIVQRNTVDQVLQLVNRTSCTPA